MAAAETLRWWWLRLKGQETGDWLPIGIKPLSHRHWARQREFLGVLALLIGPAVRPCSAVVGFDQCL